MPAPCFVDHSQDIEAESQARAARNETQLQYCAQGSRLALKLETITNLAENDVPRAVISTLFHEDLKAQVAIFTQWDGLDAMPDLWRHHAHVGGVRTARATRESAAEAKAMGCRLRRPEEADDEDDIVDSDLTHGRSTAWWDEANGLPSPLEETGIVLLDFGPMPANYAVLWEKHIYAGERVVVLISHTAPIDPYESLGEDESQIKSSWREFATTGGTDTDIILRDALLTRNPCKFLTDTRKCARSRPITDGDYDGAAGVFFYDPTLVEPFTNADERLSLEDATKDFTHKPTPQSWGYSAFHDYAIYALGYTHPETIRLTYMFCTLLDLFKNGRVLMGGVMSGDFAKYGKRPPAWKESKEDDDRHVNSTSNTLDPKRGHK
ncbi:hypothetical protein FIBSPDRAFT_965827 [Athelia psychrophila]|uniref:Uncharacterized protein n=1 Tax=Athelia psychrophila TaxID=1759441 RepID=A0A167XH42_9AGAM|nr:hypothetical protein FIBSPDRAFT_965827 [Fibularhizoctonia sp. CBS 109695]